MRQRYFFFICTSLLSPLHPSCQKNLILKAHGLGRETKISQRLLCGRSTRPSHTPHSWSLCRRRQRYFLTHLLRTLRSLEPATAASCALQLSIYCSDLKPVPDQSQFFGLQLPPGHPRPHVSAPDSFSFHTTPFLTHAGSG